MLYFTPRLFFIDGIALVRNETGRIPFYFYKVRCVVGTFIPWDSQPLAEWSNTFARGKIIELDGNRTHYIEKGEGDPVILIHGFFFDTHLWDRNIDVLAQDFKVYAIDLWGFGYSTRQDLDFGYPLYARQLKLFMDGLGLSRASLIGQSMGAGTIVKFSISNRDRVDKIVLVDPAILPNKLPLIGQITNLPGVGEFFFGLNSNFVRTLSLRSAFIHKKEHITDQYFERVTRYQKVQGTTEVMLKILRKKFFHTLQAEIHQLGTMDVPAFVVGGRQSAGIPIRLTQEVHRILVGSRLEILDQAGHCPNDEQAEAFNRLALNFLQE